MRKTQQHAILFFKKDTAALRHLQANRTIVNVQTELGGQHTARIADVAADGRAIILLEDYREVSLAPHEMLNLPTRLSCCALMEWVGRENCGHFEHFEHPSEYSDVESDF